MEKNSAKISLGTVVCMFVILLLIIALAVVYYLGFIKYTERIANADVVGDKEGMQATNVLIENNEDKEPQSNIILKNEINEELKIEENTQTQVPTSDLVTLYLYSMNDSTDVFYAYIENGYLYYFKEHVEFANETIDRQVVFLNNGQTEKYADLDNIKRIKTFNIGTGINPTPFLITEDGKVYEIVHRTMDNSMKVELYEGLKDYKVEDILSQNGELDVVFELLLKDGTTTTVTIDLGI